MAAVSRRHIDALIIGGGHAGVNMALWLSERDRQAGTDEATPSYLVLERSSTLLHAWRDMRWEGFQLNTPVNFSLLHGEAGQYGGCRTLDRPLADDLARWDATIAAGKLHVELEATVTSVTLADDGRSFDTTYVKNGETHIITSRTVVVATGAYSHCVIPQSLSTKLTAALPEVKQHTVAGLKFSHLQPAKSKDGGRRSGVLVVGGGQSGCQLAQLIAEREPERAVYWCVSKNSAVPRSYRGRDLFEWLKGAGFLDLTKEHLAQMPPEKAVAIRHGKPPLALPNRPVSHHSLKRLGVTVLSGLADVDPSTGVCHLKNDRRDAVAFADAAYERNKALFAGEAAKAEDRGEAVEPYVPEAEWESRDQELLDGNGPSELDLRAENIVDIVWATGFRPNFDWLKIDKVRELDFDDAGCPKDLASVAVPGLFFTGFPWVGHQQSLNIVGFERDHAIITDRIRQPASASN